MAKAFIKSAGTTTSPAKSGMEVERMLRRYGAAGYSVSNDYAAGRVSISFIVPNTTQKDAQPVPVRLPVSIRTVYDAMYGRPQRWRYDPDTQRSEYVHDPKGYDAKRLEQAERVAWRQLVLWIDAALSAAQAGLQTITEAFFAHTVIPDEHGQPVRMADYMERVQGQLAPGVRALLAAPAESSDG